MTKPTNLTPLEAVNQIRSNHNGQVVVVLQGGGALGAYQGGVYQALHEAGIFRSSGAASNAQPSGAHFRPGPA